ncbi:MAG: ribosomal protein [Acidimicrobiales bacterium]|jgi:large subunit ribosomal protein L29|nr:ribosomal protein [Acidimicrobiales bacterium]
MPAPIVALRALGDSELVERLDEARTELFNLRFQNATGRLENSARLRDLRKEVARIHTLLREREIEAAESAEGTR